MLLAGAGTDKRWLREVLHRVGLDERAGHRPAQLSGGAVRDLPGVTAANAVVQTSIVAGYTKRGDRSADAQALNAWVNYLLVGVLLGYMAISVANSLVMSTHARARELALLRLVGSTHRQVLRTMRWESVIVVLTATVIGAAIAGTALVMLSIGLTGSPVPHVPLLAGAALLAGVAALGTSAIVLPARSALRSNPAEAITIRE